LAVVSMSICNAKKNGGFVYYILQDDAAHCKCAYSCLTKCKFGRTECS
jgi:hypothetical protein